MLEHKLRTNLRFRLSRTNKPIMNRDEGRLLYLLALLVFLVFKQIISMLSRLARLQCDHRLRLFLQSPGVASVIARSMICCLASGTHYYILLVSHLWTSLPWTPTISSSFTISRLPRLHCRIKMLRLSANNFLCVANEKLNFMTTMFFLFYFSTYNWTYLLGLLISSF